MRGRPVEEQNLALFYDNKGAVVFLRKIHAGLIPLPVPHRPGDPLIWKRETSWKFLTGDRAACTSSLSLHAILL